MHAPLQPRPAGDEFVSNPSDALDPIALAQGEISRSKVAIASAAKDLDQHDRGLKDFIATEKRGRARHARRIRRQQAAEHLRLRRQRMARSAKHAALRSAVFVRSVSQSSANGLAYAGRQIWKSARWVGQTGYALSVGLLNVVWVGASRIRARTRAAL